MIVTFRLACAAVVPNLASLFRLTSLVSLPPLIYSIARFLARLIFLMAGRLHVLRREQSTMKGGFVLAANHISHFDPPLVSVAVLRPIRWMAMAELFENPWSACGLRALGCFSADRARPDRTTVKTALDLLRGGSVVGMFPEGGIRAGETSILEGAPMRPGVATLAEMAGVPVLPCVVVGTDRLYARERWWPPRQSRFWIGFGQPLQAPEAPSRKEARARLEADLAQSFRELFEEMKTHYSLCDDDLPQTPQRRKGRE
jgi:1-acyl-sn-glycerol-3-phosphate acyltransferase